MGLKRKIEKMRGKKFATKESRAAMRTDKEYWGAPLVYRLYIRVFYAFAAFIYTTLFLSFTTGFGIGVQCVFGGMMALVALIWRQAFPNGLQPGEWIKEGMYEAAIDKEMRSYVLDNKKEDPEIVERLKQSLRESGVSEERINEITAKSKKEALEDISKKMGRSNNKKKKQ